MSIPERTPADLNRERARLNAVTQKTRFSLIQDVLGHPSGLPTLKELDYMNPSKSRTTIRQHLQTLIEVDVIEERSLHKDQRRNDLPYRFYAISEEGRRFLDAHKLLRAEDTLETIYSQVKKTNYIERYENAPRPDQ